MFEQMMAPASARIWRCLLRNEEGPDLHEESLESQHGTALSAELADGTADPRLVKFLHAARGDDVLACRLPRRMAMSCSRGRSPTMPTISAIAWT